jgi:hypothetical protein
VELSFETEALRDICEKRATATSHLGGQLALELEQCLADIVAARSVAEFEVLFPNLIDASMKSERSIEFASGQKIIFRAGHIKVPTKPPSATVDWQRVTRIRILGIKSDHE